MPTFRVVSPQAFDAVIKAQFSRDEHELLESRFYNDDGQIIAKVVRYLDENGELVPEADLMIAD